MRQFQFLLCLLLISESSPVFSQQASLISTRYYQGDSLQGFDFKNCGLEMQQSGLQQKMNRLEAEQFLETKQRLFVQKKYHQKNWIQSEACNATHNSAGRSILPNPLAVGCNNLDFESGDFTGWYGSTGFNPGSATPLITAFNPPGFFYPAGMVDGAENSCNAHTIVNASAGNDPYGGFPMVYPGGGNYSVRLGGEKANVYGPSYGLPCNSGYHDPGRLFAQTTTAGGSGDVYSGGEKISNSFVVTKANALFTYNYAVVLQDGGHPNGDQPYFEVSVLDSANNVIPCLQYYQQCTIGTPPPGYFKSTVRDSVFYCPWQSNSFDLSAYIGKAVTIIFTAAGCDQGGHFGYAYVDGSCGPKELTINATSLCVGNTAVISSPPTCPGTTFLWSEIPSGSGIISGLTGSSITVNQSGHYEVTITHGTCSYKIDTTITFYPYPILTPASVSNSSCNGANNGTASVTVSGTPLPVTYTWSPAPGGGQGTAHVTGLGPGSYTVTVSNSGGCSTSTVVSITQPTAIVSANTQTNATCFGSCSATATVSVSGGVPPYTYSWSPLSNTNPSVNGLCQGAYTCVISDKQQCLSKQVFTITQPPALTGVDSVQNASCKQGNGKAFAGAHGGTGSYQYSWSPAPASGQTGPWAVNLPAGTYTCVVTDQTGCKVTVKDSVGNSGNVPVILLTSSGPTTFCRPGSVTLLASGGANYSWSTGALTDSIRVHTSGVYVVHSSNVCGSDSAQIAVAADSIPLGVLSGPTEICAGSVAVLTASGGTSYSWNTGANTNSIVTHTPGSYWVMISNHCGTDTVLTKLGVDSVTALFTPNVFSGYTPLPVTFADSSSLNTVTWSWSFGDGSGGTGKDPVHVFVNGGVYPVILTVTDAFGCVNTYTQTIVVTDLPSWIAVPNVFTPNGDGTNDIFKVTSQGLTSFEARIYDRWGVQLAELVAKDQGWDGRTSAGLPVVAGTYYYIIHAKGDDAKVYDLKGFFMLLHN